MIKLLLSIILFSQLAWSHETPFIKAKKEVMRDVILFHNDAVEYLSGGELQGFVETNRLILYRLNVTTSMQELDTYTLLYLNYKQKVQDRMYDILFDQTLKD